MARPRKCSCNTCPYCIALNTKQQSRANRQELRAKEKYPKPIIVTLYQCSDSAEFSSQIEALEYELALYRDGKRRIR